MIKETHIHQNPDELYTRTLEYCASNGIKKILFFIQKEEKIREIFNIIKSNNYDIEIIGVTFPANEIIYVEQEDEIEEYVPEAANGERVKNSLSLEGIKLISGTLPFEGIVIPGAGNNPYLVIKQTLDIISPGLQSAVQVVLMATDQGALIPGEKVVSMNNRISLEIISSNTRLMFHPTKKMKINHIISSIES